MIGLHLGYSYFCGHYYYSFFHRCLVLKCSSVCRIFKGLQVLREKKGRIGLDYYYQIIITRLLLLDYYYYSFFHCCLVLKCISVCRIFKGLLVLRERKEGRIGLDQDIFCLVFNLIFIILLTRVYVQVHQFHIYISFLQLYGLLQFPKVY